MGGLPEGRQPLTWKDMEFASAPKKHPSTWEQEVKALRGHVHAALDCLEASKFTNAEHARAKDILRRALGDGQ